MKSLVIEGRVDIRDAARLAILLEKSNIPALNKSDLVNKAFALAVRALTGADELGIDSVEDAAAILHNRNLLYAAGSRKMKAVVTALQVEHLQVQDVADLAYPAPLPQTKKKLSAEETIRETLEKIKERAYAEGARDSKSGAVPSKEGERKE